MYIQKPFLASINGQNISYLYLVLYSEPSRNYQESIMKSQTNQRLSAYAQNVGTFDFNTTPMAPPGTKVIAHKITNQRATWSKHGVAGFYIVPELEHYSCYRIFVTEDLFQPKTSTFSTRALI